MGERLSALGASFLHAEEPTTPMHVGAVSLFRRPRSGFDYERMVAVIEQRIALVPRYRQKVRAVPGWPDRSGSMTPTSALSSRSTPQGRG